MKEIFLIRHARQDIRVFNEDVPLSERGIRQAELLKKRFEGESFDKFYSSTLKRAVETADIINEDRHMTIERRPELNEIDYGDLTNEPLSVKNDKYKDFFSRLESRFDDIPFPGGENTRMAYERAEAVFKEIEMSRYKRILIITHGGLIRSLLCGLLDLPTNRRLVFSKHLENTSMTKLLYDEESSLYYLETLNDHQHLIGHKELFREL